MSKMPCTVTARKPIFATVRRQAGSSTLRAWPRHFFQAYARPPKATRIIATKRTAGKAVIVVSRSSRRCSDRTSPRALPHRSHWWLVRCSSALGCRWGHAVGPVLEGWLGRISTDSMSWNRIRYAGCWSSFSYWDSRLVETRSYITSSSSSETK
jgi:hypothetical protein